MVSVNMAAIPSELAAAALFGSSRGAFTGADRTTLGYFEQAQGGSLFLDEIGEASLEVQPLLLRALQQREIQVVGGVIRRIDVRVISATDAALDAVGCDFKAALRHRLGAFEIVLPPLREHPEDIGELLLYFLQGSAAEAQRSEVLPHAQSPERDIAAWAILFFRFVSYSWPGNVRELANFAQQIILASEKNLTLNENVYSAFLRTVVKRHQLRGSQHAVKSTISTRPLLIRQWSLMAAKLCVWLCSLASRGVLCIAVLKYHFAIVWPQIFRWMSCRAC